MARHGKCFRLFLQDESGNILILVAFMMVVLLGASVLAVDAGSLYQTRRQMVNAADAAALAGAQEMIYGGNVAGVVDLYAMNYHGADNAEIIEITDTTITVRAEKEATLWFYPALLSLLGGGSGNASTVSAVARAEIYNPKNLSDLVPIAVTNFDYTIGENYKLTSTEWDDTMGPGNFGFIHFDDTTNGLPPVSAGILNGYSGTVSIGDPLYPEPGISPANHLINAVDSRAGDVVLVPLIDPSYVPGASGTFEVVGFAAFIIDEYNFKGSDKYISGTFVEFIAVDKIGAGDAPDKGVFSVWLTDVAAN